MMTSHRNLQRQPNLERMLRLHIQVDGLYREHWRMLVLHRMLLFRSIHFIICLCLWFENVVRYDLQLQYNTKDNTQEYASLSIFLTYLSSRNPMPFNEVTEILFPVSRKALLNNPVGPPIIAESTIYKSKTFIGVSTIPCDEKFHGIRIANHATCG